MSDLDKTIGLRLKIARKSAGYDTAIEFSSHFGMAKSTYSQHENGNRSLTATLIMHYSDILCIDPGWLLTGHGHPCPLDKDKKTRKIFIDDAVSKLQDKNKLPITAHTKILPNDNAAIVNMELFKLILITAFQALLSRKLSIAAEELINFCIEIYNNIDILSVPTKEKEKIIALSVNSMLSGSKIILQSVKV